MSLRDNPELKLFEIEALAGVPKRRKRMILARCCWTQCNLSYDTDGYQTLLPDNQMTCDHCGGATRLTARRVEPDVVEALIQRAKRLSHIIRAQNERRRYERSRKGKG